MTDKKAILEKILPAAVLKALTPAAEQAVPPAAMVDDIVPLRNFPYRVGRETRVKIVDGRVERTERLQGDTAQPSNDLYLVDEGHLLNISREHFQIERDDDKFYLYDRGSSNGTYVERRQVGGGASEDTVELRDGDTIIVGSKESPYIFQFIVLDDFEVQPCR
ncbi:MAG: FHA domain-containing protein [Desulfocapsaceae bacterium]|nr:FHA domain-containing protein [Desulfocapsaceae bacterium]